MVAIPIVKQILANTAMFARTKFDSELELPSNNQLTQNAWLTLTLKVFLNFADSKNVADNVVMQGTKAFAKDADGYLFPILDWGNVPAYKEKLKSIFQTRAEKVWNWQFLLKTPKDYEGLDSSCSGWVVRPNVLCLFRCVLVNSSVQAHKTINLVKLKMGTTSVANADPAIPPKPVAAPYTSYTFRSDDSHYDDEDAFAPLVYDPVCQCYHDTIGHEIRHALNQDHIMGLKGTASCNMGSDDGNASICYGGTAEEKADIMGKGDRIYLLNSLSWSQRMKEHAPPTLPQHWEVTGIMTLPPRKVPLIMTSQGKMTHPAF